MSLLIAHVESERAAEWKGYLYAVGLLAVLVIQSLANAYSSQMMYILGMNVKTAVTAAVYRDGLLSSSGEKNQFGHFCCCCTADSQTGAGRHQLYNNGSLVLHSTACLL